MVYVALEWILQPLDDFITSFTGYLDIIGSLNFVDIEYLILQFSELCQTIHLLGDGDTCLVKVHFQKFQSSTKSQILLLAKHILFFFYRWYYSLLGGTEMSITKHYFIVLLLR